MVLAKNFYDILADILVETQQLNTGASLRQTDRVMAKCFGVSESTARNWRRGKHRQIAPATAKSIIAICEHVAPGRVSDLEFIARLSRGVNEVKAAAETLVSELEFYVFEDNANWHIYSGPLKVAFDISSSAARRHRLLHRSSMIVDRILEMGIDKADIPCMSELIRYSMHGWYVNGLYKTRVSSVSSRNSGIYDGYLGTVEEALYIGDGCATPCLISGYPEQAEIYTKQALALLEQADKEDEQQSAISIDDARMMIRSIQTIIACHWRPQERLDLITQFAQDYGSRQAEIEWIEGTRREALGYSELIRSAYRNAAEHFEHARIHFDNWLAQFDIPFSSTSSQSLAGYALLMAEGPTPQVKSQISEGLVRTIDLGTISHEVRARLCLSRFFEVVGDKRMAIFHRGRARELVQRHNLHTWYEMIVQILD